MTYANFEDLTQRIDNETLVYLADADGDGAADSDILAHVLGAAQGFVDSHLARRFAVPINLSIHPDLIDLLRSITLDVAEFRLRLRKPPVSDDCRRLHQAATVWLEQIAKGNIDLPTQSTPAPSRNAAFRAQAIGEPRTLNRQELEDL